MNENAWKGRDGASDADGQVVDLRLDGPAPDTDGPVADQKRPDGPPPVTECNDGLDNDGDGAIDFKAAGGDPGCSGPSDPSEQGSIACDDGQDNDSDGKTDYKSDGSGDPDCAGPADGSEDAGTCTSWSEFDCTQAAVCIASCPPGGATQLFIIVCTKNGCTCTNNTTQASNSCATQAAITCATCQNALSSGCCSGL